MKTVILLAALFTLGHAELVPVSYHDASGAYVEELVPAGHWRTQQESFVEVRHAAPTRYESEIVFKACPEFTFIALDIGAFFRNENLRQEVHQSRGYLVELDGNSVTGQPENEEPGFWARQGNNVRETWQENPWKVAAIGGATFLALDYFVVDSGEINAWGLLSSDNGGSSTPTNATENASRAGGNAATIQINGNNNAVTINNNDSDNTSTPTVVQ